jgi:hypothetical protein
MIIDVTKPMSPRQLEMFWNEIDAIQSRSQPWFTQEQKEAISIQVAFNKATILEFSDAYNLPEEVSREIHLIFKLVAVSDDVYEEYQMLRNQTL